MAKKSKSHNYREVIEQNQAYRDTLNDHLKNSDVQKIILDSLENHSEFGKIVVHVLWGSARFWLWLLGVALIVAVGACKFPELARLGCFFFGEVVISTHT